MPLWIKLDEKFRPFEHARTLVRTGIKLLDFSMVLVSLSMLHAQVSSEQTRHFI